MQEKWYEWLTAWLHDPPDKGLEIRGHEGRAKKYIREALGDRAAESVKSVADQQAARAERLPVPHWERAKVDAGESFITFHPLSAGVYEVAAGKLDSDAIINEIRRINSAAGNDTQRRFFAHWRLLPERLAADRPESARWPADTRVPDHTIWNHLDITAGLQAAEVETNFNAAFLGFSVGPVQPFIEAARSVRDLWSGSMILSYLAFRGMLPLIETFGPTVLVYPSMRGVPLLDIWLRNIMDFSDELVEEPRSQLKLAPCIPNRFLAVVPYGIDGAQSKELANKCLESSKLAWQDIAQSVRERLDKQLSNLNKRWDERWTSQIDSYFDFRTAILPWQKVSGSSLYQQLRKNEKLQAIETLQDCIPEDEKPGRKLDDGSWRTYDRTTVGDWQAKVELAGRLMESLKSVRNVSAHFDGRLEVPPKCTMFGTFEQLGPTDFQKSAIFWSEAAKRDLGDGVRIRERERFCAMAMVKRLAGPCFFREALQLDRADLRYDDTATIAASAWLKHAEIEPSEMREKHRQWSGQWLHWPRPDFDRDDPCPEKVWETIQDAKARMHVPPPAYYAILMMDGDDLGKWLRGENSPEVQKIFHPELLKYYSGKPGATDGLSSKRPVSPALHAAISTALANFALHAAPPIVESHEGIVIYSGGDDTLSLLPTCNALKCAKDLRDAYRSDYYPHSKDGRMMMGAKATLSAGLAIVHYKEDLRDALKAARAAEKKAKKSGKDALAITACRRSGEHSTALCSWDFVETVSDWVHSFANPNVSDRWAYRLRAEMPTLQGLNVDAIKAELRRQINRGERPTRDAFAPNTICEKFDKHRGWTKRVADEDEYRFQSDQDAFVNFLTLVQTASFLARGRDR